jgi:hypothetical protein
MRASKARTGPRIGQPCHRRWNAYGKSRRKGSKERFIALFHHISIDLLDEAFYELKENAAAGVDGLTWPPQPRILHPYLDKRFAATHPRWEPCAGIPPARI